MMANRDPAAFQALLRTTLQHLSQVQERKHSQHQITRRDVAKLLYGGNIVLARAKAQNLLQDDKMNDLLDVLALCVGTVLDHTSKLDNGPSYSRAVIEAASTIVYAAPRMELKDLNLIRDTLIQRLGRTFAQSASTNSDRIVFPRVTEILSSPAPTAAIIDEYLLGIADTYGVRWTPEPGRQDITGSLSEILDPKSSPVIDLARLRKLCSHGLPDDPPWIRPQIWRLLFGTLSASKVTWAKDNFERRESYYGLVRRLLTPITSLPPPLTPLSHTDATLLQVSESLLRLPPELFSLLRDETESNDLCPFDATAKGSVKLDCAHNLDRRLEHIRKASNKHVTLGIPGITLAEPPDASSPDSPPDSEEDTHKMLLQPKLSDATLMHQKHHSALIRLLYLHACLNPVNQAPHTPALLVPLYSAVTRELEPAEAAHAEADTFWLFEALIGELVEFEDEEGGHLWARRFSDKLTAVDEELAMDLHAKGLDPALPHYSPRWLATLLAQTLPLSSIFPVWDVIFACPARTRDSSPRLTCLVDICVSLLIQARTPLLQLGRSGNKTAGLWNPESPLPSSLRPWELSNAFMEGIALLQGYPIEAMGGIDRVLQTSFTIPLETAGEETAQKTDGLTLGARLKATVWKGFANPLTTLALDDQEDTSEDEESEEHEHDDGNDTETPAEPSLTSRIANTVWRGITNQTSMEDEIPSPQSPPRSPSPPTPQDDAKKSHPQPVQATLWNYAGKLKDSDTAATFAKVSTNWRAMAMNAWSSRRGSNASASDARSPGCVSSEFPPFRGVWPDARGAEHFPDSVSNAGSENSADPLFPVFRSPRESFFPQPRRQPISAPPSPDTSAGEDNTFLKKTKTSLASIASQIRPLPAKSAPRPLLLSSRSVIASAPHSPPHSRSGTPSLRQGQWSDVLSRNREARQGGSISSTSSAPQQEITSRRYPYSTGPRSDYDSDGSGRRIPLNRKSISPMALGSRSPRLFGVTSPSAHSSDASFSSYQEHARLNPSVTNETTSERGWCPVDVRTDSPTTTVSSPGSATPLHARANFMGVNGIERVPVSAGGSVDVPLVLGPPARSGAIVRKRTPPPQRRQNDGGDDTSDSSLSLTPSAPQKSPRLRTKRYITRPASLRIVDDSKAAVAADDPRKSMSAGLNLSTGLGPSSSPLLVPESAEEQALTPKAGDFRSNEPSPRSVASVSPRRSPRKLSGEGAETQTRKGVVDGHVRARKLSSAGRESKRRDSDAEEGDDEAYDELLSAYESEQGTSSGDCR